METAKRLFGVKLSSEISDLRFGQIVCIATALAVLCLGLWKLTHLDLTEVEVFLGLLLTLCISVLFVILGQLLWLSHYVKVWRERKRKEWRNPTISAPAAANTRRSSDFACGARPRRRLRPPGR